MKKIDFQGIFYNIEDYKHTKQKVFLGSGVFGSVYTIWNTEEKKTYAIKILDKIVDFNARQQMLLMREAIILSQIHHPAIIKFKGVNLQSFENENILQPSIITEYMPNKSLKYMLDNEKLSKCNHNWTPTKKYIAMLGIAHAMSYLHNHSIVHRDLKPENVLIDSDFYPQICDFGLARFLPDSITKSGKFPMTGDMGTPAYMAPELLKGAKSFTEKVDVYAFSMIAYEIVSGIEPYSDVKFNSTLDLCRSIIKDKRPKIPGCVTKKMRSLLTRCWHKDSEERPSFDEIFQLLSTDFSYLNESVDSQEIKDYISLLNDGVQEEQPIVTERNNGLDSTLQTKNNDTCINDELIRGLNGILGHQKERNLVESATYLRLSSKKGSSLASYILGLLYESGKGVEANFEEAKRYYKESANQGNSYGYSKLGQCYEFGYGVGINKDKSFKYYQKAANLDNPMGLNGLAILSYENKTANPYLYYKEAADLGDLNSLIYLSHCYRYGIGVDSDESQAFKYAKQAADLGLPYAIRTLGEMYEAGDGVKKNYEEAFKLYEQAASLGNSYAYNNLGLCYDSGIGVDEDVKKGLDYFIKGANLNNPLCYYNLAFHYHDGQGVKQNYNKAYEYFKKAADLGHPHSYCMMGTYHKDGLIGLPDLSQTIKFYQLAVDLNDQNAMILLGDCYRLGEGVDQNYSQAFHHYKQAADLNNMIGLRMIGLCYQNGWGTKQNLLKANSFFKRASQLEDAESYRLLGENYRKGDGINEPDPKKAVEMYRMAIKGDCLLACISLGQCYLTGFGVKRDYVKAYKLFKKAAEAGEPNGIVQVGLAYYKGIGVSQDYSKAIEYFEKGMQLNNDRAYYYRGKCYEKGHGSEQKMKEAIQCYKKSKELGNNDAKIKLDNLKSKALERSKK